jgi:hypothetical protein
MQKHSGNLVLSTWMELPAKGMNGILGYFFMSPAMVCHDIKNQVLSAIIGDLVRLVWLEKESIPLPQSASFPMANDAAARNHMVELPLRAMGMVGIRRLPRRDTANLDIKRMSFVQIR